MIRLPVDGPEHHTEAGGALNSRHWCLRDLRHVIDLCLAHLKTAGRGIGEESQRDEIRFVMRLEEMCGAIRVLETVFLFLPVHCLGEESCQLIPVPGLPNSIV